MPPRPRLLAARPGMGDLASRLRRREAQGRFRRQAARPMGVEPCLAGDGNGNVTAWIDPSTGLPTDHIWVRMLNQGGRPMVARNFSGHAWTDGERILCEYIGTAAGHILSVIYREKALRKQVLYAFVTDTTLGSCLLMADPRDDPTGNSTTTERLPLPPSFVIADFYAQGGVLYALQSLVQVSAYSRATGWVDTGIPASNPGPSGTNQNAAFFRFHGLPHLARLSLEGDGAHWEIWRFDGTVAARIYRSLPVDFTGWTLTGGVATAPDAETPGADFVYWVAYDQLNAPDPGGIVYRIMRLEYPWLDGIGPTRMTAMEDLFQTGFPVQLSGTPYKLSLSDGRLHINSLEQVWATTTLASGSDSSDWSLRFEADADIGDLTGNIVEVSDAAVVPYTYAVFQWSSGHPGPPPAAVDFNAGAPFNYATHLIRVEEGASSVDLVSVRDHTLGARFFAPLRLGTLAIFANNNARFNPTTDPPLPLAQGIYAWDEAAFTGDGSGLTQVVPFDVIGRAGTNVLGMWRGEAV